MLLNKITLWSTDLNHDQNLVECRHQVSASAAVDYELFSLSYTPPHNLHSSQTCCRCLHSRRSRTPRSDLMNLRTSRVERSPHTDLSPSPAANICLQYSIYDILYKQWKKLTISPLIINKLTWQYVASYSFTTLCTYLFCALCLICRP